MVLAGELKKEIYSQVLIFSILFNCRHWQKRKTHSWKSLFMRGQNRPPPSGGVTSANPQRALTAKDIKVIMNNPSDANRETPEILTRKDSKLGRKDKLQMSEKEAAQMTKSKEITYLTSSQFILTNHLFLRFLRCRCV